MQGLNTTSLHGHTALFGVYGMLGIGLMLVCLRAMEPRAAWKEGWLRFAFWGMNAGLLIMWVEACCRSVWPKPGPRSKKATGMLAAPNSSDCLACRLSDGCASRGDTIFTVATVVLVVFVFAGRSGSGRSSEELLPDAVHVPSGD